MDGSLGVDAKHPEKINKITIDTSRTTAKELSLIKEHYKALFSDGADFFVTDLVLLVGEVPEFIEKHDKQIKCDTLALSYHRGCLAKTMKYFVGFSTLTLIGEIDDDTAKEVVGLPPFSFSVLDVQHLDAAEVCKLEDFYKSAKPINLVLSLEGFTECQRAIFEGMDARSKQVIEVKADNRDLLILMEMNRDTVTVQYTADNLIAHFQVAVLAVKKVAFWQFATGHELSDSFFVSMTSGWKTAVASLQSHLTEFKQKIIDNRAYMYRFV